MPNIKNKDQSKNFSRSIKVCLNNGLRLLEEAEYSFYCLSPTALALAILAQEEFSKAFILQLVREEVLPWAPEVRRSLSNHECKHLIGILMEWLLPSDKDVWRRSNAQLKGDSPDKATADVCNAINIYRHEMIEKFGKRWPLYEPEWNGMARKIAKGLIDREKQSCFYVSIGHNGEVASIPTVTATKLKNEIERANRFREISNDAYNQTILSHREYQWLKDILRIIFKNISSYTRIDKVN